MEKKKMVILTGPTAVGKTALSIALAKQVGGAVISADSMQIYRYMDIGSAKITPEEMQGIPHYLIGELDPKEEFNVVRFAGMAKQYLETIYEENKVPIIVGGTGFYIQALLYDIHFSEQECDTAYRRQLMAQAEEKGAAYLHETLKRLDPESAAAIHANNIRRIVRALEYYHLTGEKISEHNKAERERTSPYNFAYFVLNDKRQEIYRKIDQRVDGMIAKGLVEEVKRLREMGCRREMVSMQGLGYKEIFDYLDGLLAFEEAVRIIKRETRHFAKRQLTWFGRERDVIWLEKEQFHYQDSALLDEMLRVLSEKSIYVR